VLEKINTALRAALKDPELVKRQQAVGITVVTDGRIAPAEHKRFFESEVARWTRTIRDSGIQPE
jgi:tripartite-type tricarboxylate transporter receptor subunit TctC